MKRFWISRESNKLSFHLDAAEPRGVESLRQIFLYLPQEVARDYWETHTPTGENYARLSLICPE